MDWNFFGFLYLIALIVCSLGHLVYWVILYFQKKVRLNKKIRRYTGMINTPSKTKGGNNNG